MKKIISVLTAGVMCAATAIPTLAYYIGESIGTVYYTDIVAYINNYAIPSYAASGTSVVVAEDLREFGFDVEWNEEMRTLNITRNSDTVPKGMEFEKNGVPSMPFTNILYTDIAVYANGERVPSYAINGYTMIPLESLTMFGDYVWNNDDRTLKLTVDGLEMRSKPQEIERNTVDFRSPIAGGENLIDGLSANERYELNIFLSNFYEVGFAKYDELSNDNNDLIYFGCMHNAANRTSSAVHITESEAADYVNLDDDIHSCYKVSKEGVENSVKRYFGKTVEHTSARYTDSYGFLWEQGYNNGTYYFDYGEEGAVIVYVAIADAMYKNYDGTYTVSFNGYISDANIIPSAYYCSANSVPNDYGRKQIFGKAIVRPYEYNGRNTYQLVRYEPPHNYEE